MIKTATPQDLAPDTARRIELELSRPVSDFVHWDDDQHAFVWTESGVELDYDTCEALGLDGTGRSY